LSRASCRNRHDNTWDDHTERMSLEIIIITRKLNCRNQTRGFECRMWG
jgi:hypothetical protein